MNILTVLNDYYASYGRMFFHSLSKISDYEKINKIYVIDTGLSHEIKREFDPTAFRSLTLPIYSKIKIIESPVHHVMTSHNTRDWREVVDTKVKGLIKLVEANELPICMIDIDCYFKENFLDEIDSSCDINVCKRREPATFRGDITMSHIGSFFVANNNERALEFLYSWVEEMKQMDDTHIETPALCNLLERHENDPSNTFPEYTGRRALKIKHLDQDIISSNKLTEESKIIHLKSQGTGYPSTYESRARRVKSLVNPDDYLSPLALP